MKAWLYRTLFTRGGGVFRVLPVIGCILLAAVSHAHADLEEQAAAEVGRAKVAARALEIGPLREPDCFMEGRCLLGAVDIGSIGVSIGRDGILYASGTPAHFGQAEETMCRWVFALLTGIEDPAILDPLIQRMIKVLDGTGLTKASNSEFPASLELERFPEEMITCRGRRAAQR